MAAAEDVAERSAKTSNAAAAVSISPKSRQAFALPYTAPR